MSETKRFASLRCPACKGNSFVVAGLSSINLSYQCTNCQYVCWRHSLSSVWNPYNDAHNEENKQYGGGRQPSELELLALKGMKISLSVSDWQSIIAILNTDSESPGYDLRAKISEWIEEYKDVAPVNPVTLPKV